ncbi:MAG: ribonuclease D [Gammaproteobacteria bacterium]
MKILPPVRYINTPAALMELCVQLRGNPWLALDTEFLREKTYYPKLCLLQIATPELVACIDPLALEDLSPLLDVIYEDGITKVLHAARQDMEIFFHLRNTLPSPVFDTQIAALLLGFPDQIGYGNLVKGTLGIELEKLHTRTDWSRRPLSDEQIHYAAEDVFYLAQVYPCLVEKLSGLGRLDWLSEDFVRLTQVELYNNDPAQAWLKVRGSNRLKGAGLSVLQALAEWRETVARDQNRPRGWLLRDDELVEIARHQPGTPAALGAIRGLHERFIDKHGARLLELVAEARERAPKPLSSTGLPVRLSPLQDALVDAMMAVVRVSGAENALNPAVLASRKQLEQLATGAPDSEVLHGWRGQLVGQRLQALLAGDLGLYARNGAIELRT